MPDVIVVGARCAGATTAMLLARAGADVLLVDRARFPSDIPHGHFIHRHGPRRLAAWGLLDAVLATNCPPVTRSASDAAGLPLASGGLQTADGVPMGLGPRRSRFDAVLVDAAVRAGAELREGFAVDDVTTDTDGARVTGVLGRTTGGGAPVREPARVVVGADGRNSPLARRVGATAAVSAPTQTCWYFTYFGGVPADGLEVYNRAGLVIFAFPTNDDLFAVFVGSPIEELPQARADPAGHVMRAVERIPALAERVRAGTQAERVYGASRLPNFLRAAHGPGWALVGDAGCHKDPYMALGVCDALRDAEGLAGAIAAGLAGREDLDAALARYQRERDAATLPDYHANLARARLDDVAPEERRLRAALQGNDADTHAFFAAVHGLIPFEDFFRPDNLRRVIAGA